MPIDRTTASVIEAMHEIRDELERRAPEWRLRWLSLRSEVNAWIIRALRHVARRPWSVWHGSIGWVHSRRRDGKMPKGLHVDTWNMKRDDATVYTVADRLDTLLARLHRAKVDATALEALRSKIERAKRIRRVLDHIRRVP